MTTGKALNGKPYAGNPHARFDEGEFAPAATPRRGSLLYMGMDGECLTDAGGGCKKLRFPRKELARKSPNFAKQTQSSAQSGQTNENVNFALILQAFA